MLQTKYNGKEINQERITVWQPYQVVSLLEMLKKYAHQYFQLGKALKSIRMAFDAMSKRTKPIAGLEWPEGGALGEFLGKLQALCKKLKLAASLEQIKRINGKWYFKEGFGKGAAQEFSIDIEILEKLIEGELKQHEFLYVPSMNAPYYDKHGFSGRAQRTFSKCKFDMVESGKCLALGRYPACVFHLMRIVDAGLKRLGELYDIEPDHPTWGNFLHPLKTKLKALEKVDMEKFQMMGSLLERITAIKEIRNPATHSDEYLAYDSMERIEKKYSPDEARRHFANVKAFLDSLVVVLSWGKLEEVKNVDK